MNLRKHLLQKSLGLWLSANTYMAIKECKQVNLGNKNNQEKMQNLINGSGTMVVLLRNKRDLNA